MHTSLNPRSRGASVRNVPGDSPRAARGRRKFLRFFPGGFTDPTYLEWERDYKRKEETQGDAAYARPDMMQQVPSLQEFRDTLRDFYRIRQDGRRDASLFRLTGCKHPPQ